MKLIGRPTGAPFLYLGQNFNLAAAGRSRPEPVLNLARTVRVLHGFVVIPRAAKNHFGDPRRKREIYRRIFRVQITTCGEATSCRKLINFGRCSTLIRSHFGSPLIPTNRASFIGPYNVYIFDSTQSRTSNNRMTTLCAAPVAAGLVSIKQPLP